MVTYTYNSSAWEQGSKSAQTYIKFQRSLLSYLQRLSQKAKDQGYSSSVVKDLSVMHTILGLFLSTEKQKQTNTKQPSRCGVEGEGMEMQAFLPRQWQVDLGGFQASQGYIVRPCLSTKI